MKRRPDRLIDTVSRFGISALILGVVFTLGLVTRSWSQEGISCGRPFDRSSQDGGLAAAQRLVDAREAQKLGGPSATEITAKWSDKCETTGHYAIALVFGGALVTFVGLVAFMWAGPARPRE